MSQDRSDWKPNPIVERTLAQDRRQERRRRWDVALLVASSAGICPLSCLGTCLSLGGVEYRSLLFILPLASIVLLFVSLARYSSDKDRSRVRRLALRQEFDEVAGWFVALTLWQGEAISGRDVGVVWFEQNRLYFNGARTSFGLGTNDVGAEVREGSSVLDQGSSLVIPLRDSAEGRAMSIGLQFVQREPEAQSGVLAEGEFRRAMRGWLAAGEPSEGQLPPRSLGPDLPSTGSLRVRAILVTAWWPALVLATLFVGLTSGILTASFLLFVGLFSTFWIPARSPRRCWKAVRDRRGLEAYNKD